MNRFGYFRIAAGVPLVKVGDIDFNISQIKELAERANRESVDLLVLPELCVTGYTCGDLFCQPLLAVEAEKKLKALLDNNSFGKLALAVGVPVVFRGRRYNCAAVIAGGRIAGLVPKTHLPNYGEFYEKRWFESGVSVKGENIYYCNETPIGTDLIFRINGVGVSIEICEDLWVPEPPSSRMAKAGAEVICNLSASDELIGKHSYLKNLVSQQSARCRCAYAYASAGWGESSTDLVFAGKTLIAEDGFIIENETRFPTDPLLLVKDVDIEKLRNDRTRFSTFFDGNEGINSYREIIIGGGCKVEPIDKHVTEGNPLELVNVEVAPLPFVPSDNGELRGHCEEIVNIQARGLMQRLNAIGCRNAVIGISGGLDSTLALLVTVKAFDLLGLPRTGITGITMPGMATTSRTHRNAHGLMAELGVTALEIPIGKAVAQHFSDIGQDSTHFDVTYENSQARERTQILMDYSNKVNGIVIGTGDMSELALGWCTYNGDHMSMYGVNASVPKTLVRHLVGWFADSIGGEAEKILRDIIDTPISPELIPSGTDEISQKTEDLVGPYELHDFFLYHMLRNSFSPRKIYMLAEKAFSGRYDGVTIHKWLRNFYRRFFSQQFKRSCMPDGPKVGSVNLSPRGDWRMPSDASARLWIEETDSIVPTVETY